jgi:2-keto-3-deoxy-L-rhamnonate aldolase RhmA
MARTNSILAAIRDGRRARGVFLSFPSAPLIEILGRLRLDFVYLDGEHGMFELHDIADGCRAAELVGLTPIARIPDQRPSTIGRFLDAGLLGIVAPHVDTPEQAQAIVRAARFGPRGERSYGAPRPEHGMIEGGLRDWLATRSRETSVSVMIESRTAVDRAEEILAVPGIDYASIGLQDLAQSLGCPGEPAHPDVERAVARVRSAALRSGCPLREDVVRFSWIRDVVVRGVDALLTADPAAPC